MWLLLICSLLSLTVTIERLIFWYREKKKTKGDIIEQVLSLVKKGDYTSASSECNSINCSTIRILVVGLDHIDYGSVEAIQIEAENQISNMKRGLPVLDTIITMAPLLGILGTVIGIIESFDLLGVAGIEDPKAVTAGIAQALITTAAGLTVALITLVPFNYFVAKVQKAARTLEHLATQFELAYRKSWKNNAS